MITVLRESKPKARKQHHCMSCGRVIEPGNTYVNAACTDGSQAWTWKSHAACQRASQILWDKGIEGDDGCLLNVSDMDLENRDIIYQAEPETYGAVWPGTHAPSKPEMVKP